MLDMQSLPCTFADAGLSNFGPQISQIAWIPLIT